MCRDLCLRNPVGLPDLNVPCRIFAVFRRRSEVKLRGPDVGMTGELLHLLNWCAVLKRIRDRGLPERMHSDAAATYAVWIDSGFACVPLHDFPDRGSIQILPNECPSVLGNRPKERAFEIVADITRHTPVRTEIDVIPAIARGS